jgi:hypothetical protein
MGSGAARANEGTSLDGTPDSITLDGATAPDHTTLSFQRPLRKK